MTPVPGQSVVASFVHGRPGLRHDDVERLLELLKACGGASLRQAFRRVVRQREASVAAVVREINGQAPCSLGWRRLANDRPSLRRCVHKTRFALLKTVEEFDFSVQRELRRTLPGSCFSPEFVVQGRNLILTGRSGRGKTHMATAIAYKTIQNGYGVLFVSAATLIDDLSFASR